MNLKRKLSKIGALIIITAVLLQLLPTTAFASTDNTYVDGSGNTYTYTDNGDGTATITGFKSGKSSIIVIPSTVGDISNELTVTKIGTMSFYGTEITNLTIPNSVIFIEGSAFPSSKLTSITIPEGVKEIGAYAFSDCELREVIIPESVTSIGACAFLSNYLKSVTIKNSATIIGKDAFVANQNPPSDLTIYGYADSTAQAYAILNEHNFAFLSDNGGGDSEEKQTVVDGNTYTYTENEDGTVTITDFTSGGSDHLVIPSKLDEKTVAIIGNNAFEECSLTSVTIPSSVTVIGDSAFDKNYLLTNVTIENREAEIGKNAFGGHDLDLTIHGYVDSTAIIYALENTHFLAVLGGIKVTDDNGNTYTYIENEEGEATVIGFKPGVSKDIEIPESINGLSITNIYPFAFAKCGLESIIIPANVEYINLAAFAFNQLTDITIEGNPAYIDNAAFFENPEDLKICGITGSSAEAYAKEKGFTFLTIVSKDDIARFAAGSGNGTSEKRALLIETPEQLSNVRNYPDKYFKLAGNIDLTDYLSEGGDGYNEGAGWEPICGIYDEAFTGVFDGNGYTISGLNINRPSEMVQGLFGVVGKDEIIKNVKLKDINIIGGDYTGGLAGANSGTITGCHVNGNVKGSSYVGGLVGFNAKGSSSIIAGSSFSGSVEGEEKTGGLVGHNDNDAMINECKASVSVKGSVDNTGGLTGYNIGVISNSYSVSYIVGLSNVGGLAGFNQGTIEYSYAAGTVTGDTYAGGLEGSNFKDVITNSYYDNDIAGVEYNGLGTPKATSEMKQQATFEDWQFDSIWAIQEGITYPYLQWEAAPVSTTYSVTYDSNGGTGAAPTDNNSYEEGDTVTVLGNTGSLTRPGYIFDGWNTKSDGSGTSYTEGDNFTMETADALLYAKWSFDHYILTYTAGTNGEIIGTPTQTINHGEDGSEVEAVADIGYHFVEWSDGIKSAKRTDTNVTGDISVTAIFDLNQYVLSFNSNGGSEVVRQNIIYNKNGVKPQDPVKSGYIFAGWYEDTSFVTIFDFNTAIISSKTLYAKWTAANSDHDSSGGSRQDSPSNNVPVITDGQTQHQAAIGTSQIRDGSTVTTVALDSQKMTEIVNSSQMASSVTIPVTGKPDIVVGELNGQLVKAMENKQAILEIKTDDATYTLPAQQINIDSVSSQLGQTVNLSDIKVSIEIAKSSDEAVKIVEDTASKGNFSIVVPPIDFTVKCTYSDQTINISQFSSYVERTLAIPDGVDPQKITTGIVVESDGTLRHVPTKIIVIDGKYYARINSLTNSTYSVIWNPIDFKDAAAHWAKEAINDMGSRMVISGTGNDTFEPGRDITRAEFAAIIVRALGLKPGTGKTPFTDVNVMDWYSSDINTAAEYKIISGYGNGKFGPNDKITREQAMVMIDHAMNITGLKVEFVSGEVEKLLEDYKDADKFADYARNSIVACIKSGVVTGKNGKLIAPKDNITRAEVAVMIQRLLQKSNLI